MLKMDAMRHVAMSLLEVMDREERGERAEKIFSSRAPRGTQRDAATACEGSSSLLMRSHIVDTLLSIKMRRPLLQAASTR